MTATQTSNERQVIKDVCAQILTLEDRRSSISEQIRSLKNEKIKGDLGMKIADFNLAFRLYKLEHEDRDETLDTFRRVFSALDLGQQLDWVQTFSDGTTPESEEAAGDLDDLGAASTEEPAEQSDGSSVAEALDDTDKAEEHEHDDDGAELIADDDGLEQAGHAYNDGYAAGLGGKSLKDNPHDGRSNLGKQWAKGHRAGLVKRAAEAEAQSAIVEFPGGEPMGVPEFPQAEQA